VGIKETRFSAGVWMFVERPVVGAKLANLAALRGMFEETRRETIAIIGELQQHTIAGNRKVLHNQFGEITLRGWLNYLNTHANWESKKMR
jgi:hypothetical protein